MSFGVCLIHKVSIMSRNATAPLLLVSLSPTYRKASSKSAKCRWLWLVLVHVSFASSGLVAAGMASAFREQSFAHFIMPCQTHICQDIWADLKTPCKIIRNLFQRRIPKDRDLCRRTHITPNGILRWSKMRGFSPYAQQLFLNDRWRLRAISVTNATVLSYMCRVG